MKTFFRISLLTLGLLALGGSLFWYQPWSYQSPSIMAATFDPETRVQNFRTMDQRFNNALIRAASAREPWLGLEAAGPLDMPYRFRAEERVLSDFLQRTFTTGLLVLKDGEALYENYRLGETAEDRHTSWSVAKSFTSTLVGMLHDDGTIASLDDPVETYVAGLKGTAYGAASIRDVLQMSSGTTFYENYGRPGTNSAFAFSSVQEVLYRSWLFGESMNELLAGFERKEEPGTRFEYRSGDTHILAWLVQEVSGKPFETVLEERIWQPLGMTSDATWLLDGSDDPIPVGFCCLQATLRDFARLGELYRLGGVWNGQRLLSEEWIRQATTPNAAHMEPGAATRSRGYGYQWWVPMGHDREYLAMGIWGQYIWVDEKAGVVISRTSVDPDFQLNVDETIAVFRAITRHVAPDARLGNRT